MTHRVLVIGGGLSGLITAFEVQRQAAAAGLPVTVELLEADTELGGKARTLRRDGFTCEEGPNGFLDSRPAALELCARLGISGKLLVSDQSAALRFIYSRGKLRRVPTGPLGFFLSPLLSWRAKLRFLGEPWVPPAPPEADESLEQFASRRLGPQAAARLLDPMVSGVYAGDVRQISVRAAFPRIYAVEQKHGSLVRGLLAMLGERRRARRADQDTPRRGGPAGPSGRLTCFAGGMGELVQCLAERLKPECCWLGWEATDVRPAAASGGPGAGGWQVLARSAHDGTPRSWSADAVVVAAEANRAARLLEGLDPALAGPLAQIPHASAAMIGLGYRIADLHRPVRGFGFLVPSEEQRRILGCLWSSCIFPGHRSPPGTLLFGMIAGGARRPDLVELPAEELVALARDELRITMGVEAEPCFSHVKRWSLGIPQYTIGHQQRVAALQAALAHHPGLLLTGNSLYGIALPDCAASGDRVAGQVVAYLQCLRR